MTKMTKIELVQLNTKLANENAALRAQLSEAKVLVEAVKAQHPAPIAEETREHEYDTVTDAMNHCKQLVAWDTERRYMFVVRGNKVICKIRATH